MVEGRHFTVFTDHQPLIFAFNQNLEKASPQQLRHLDYIGQYSTEIKHVSGNENVVADALSRVEAISFPTNINYDEIADEHMRDTELNLIKQSSVLNIQLCPIPGSSKSIYCDILTEIPRDHFVAIFLMVYMN